MLKRLKNAVFDSPPLIITHLAGGLGNQMFQYAAGRALALRLGAIQKLDRSWFTNILGATPRDYALNVFDLPIAFATQAERDKMTQQAAFIIEPHWHYWPGFQLISSAAYLKGYWQSELYFGTFSKQIRQDFAFPPLPEGQSSAFKKSIHATSNSVAVHIRRGDYVTSAVTNATHGVCSQKYYRQALASLAAKVEYLHLFLFSDDPGWVREHFDTHGYQATVIDVSTHNKAPHHDMHLMSLCRHHIIANSSFSWWGAWLANKNGCVQAPQKWFAQEKYCDKSRFPQNWVLVDA